MKFGPASLLGGVILLAAIPVCADSILYSRATNEPANFESSASTFRASHAKSTTAAAASLISGPAVTYASAWTFAEPSSSIAQESTETEISRNETRNPASALADPQNYSRASDPAPATLSVNGSQAGGPFGFNGPEASMVFGELVPSESESSANPGDRAEFSSSESASSEFGTAGSRFGFFGNDPDHDRGGKGKKKDQSGPPVNVPEPGALPLLTLGLLAVAVMALRSRDFPPNA